MMIAGVGRKDVSPFPGVELAGWGYYIERVWKTVDNPLYATALVVESAGQSVVLITLDLMLIDAKFTSVVRRRIETQFQIPAQSIMLTCSHSHNAPAAGGLRGVGECDPDYENWAAEQAVAAVEIAFHNRDTVTLRTANCACEGLSYNRTRYDGVVDDTLTVARFDRSNGQPVAVIANFAAHPTVTTELHPWAVSRDVPGQVCDLLEAEYPGAVGMYIQGACGDTNFHRQFQTTERCVEPARRIVKQAAEALKEANLSESSCVRASSQIACLPTRRWTREEIEQDRSEAQRRIAEQDFAGWRETIGRSMTNRPDDMVVRHGGDETKAVRAMCRFHLDWTEQMLQDLDMRQEVLRTEVQAIRIGDLHIASNAAEFFAPFAIQVRENTSARHLMIACYANGRIGYLPDAYDIAAKSYAGFQSPKYCNQFPFTPESGPEMCRVMQAVVEACDGESKVAEHSTPEDQQ